MITLSLGSNLGNRLHNLQTAVALIQNRCLYNIKTSIIIETEALLLPGSPAEWNKPYFNMIVMGETSLSPEELLKALKEIELEMGRAPAYEKWSPRIIDLDILKFHDVTMQTDQLTLPHPGLKDRDFLKHLLALMGDYTQDPNILSGNIFINSFVLNPKLVGVVNITSDSFSDGGKYSDTESALAQIQALHRNGASIIEIGAQSTRPGAQMQSAEQELIKLHSVLEDLYKSETAQDMVISIDTFHPQIARELLDKYPISIINDVAGNYDDETLRRIAQSGGKFCLMHSLSIPPEKGKVIPLQEDPVQHILTWGQQSLDRLVNLGFETENIILDPGIGFGKIPYQSLEIIRRIGELKSLGVPIMVGHSRKSYITAFSLAPNAYERDPETIAISLALADSVDYVRVHNVQDHMRSLVAQQVIG